MSKSVSAFVRCVDVEYNTRKHLVYKGDVISDSSNDKLKREIGMTKKWFQKEHKEESPNVSRHSKRLKSDTETESNGKGKYTKSVEHLKEESIPEQEKKGIKTILKVIAKTVLFSVLFIIIGLVLLLNSVQYKAPAQPNAATAIQEYEQEELRNDAKLIEGYKEISPSEITAPEIDMASTKEDDLRYILLIGLDARSSNNWNNASTDVMKIAVLDENNNVIKILSFMRDILVPIDGQVDTDGAQKYGKLNSVYFYNGPDGLCETLQKYFDVPVDEYIIINWEGTTKIIDVIGGVEIDVKLYELEEINKKIKYQNKFRNLEYASELYRTGKQILNGNQALAYMRIRHVGRGDYARVERQVIVIESVFASLKAASIENILSLTTMLQDVVHTNIKPFKMTEYATMGYGMLDSDISSITIPYGDENETHYAGRYKGRYVLNVDFDANIQIIQEFLYGEE